MERNKKNLDPKQVGARIKKIRGSRTLEDFAKLLGVKHPTVYRYETDRIPEATILLKIAELGGTTVDWLLIGKDSIEEVNELPEPHGSRGKKEKRLMGEIDRLLESEDELVFQHLKRQVELLHDAVAHRREKEKKGV